MGIYFWGCRLDHWNPGSSESDLPNRAASGFLSGAWTGAAGSDPIVNFSFICDFWAEYLLHHLGLISFVPFRQMSLSCFWDGFVRLCFIS